MARAFFLHDTAHVLRLSFAEEAGVWQWFGADAAEFMAAAIHDEIAMRAEAVRFHFHTA